MSMSLAEEDDLTDKIDLIICLGGDGTLLYASSLFQVKHSFFSLSPSHGAKVPKLECFSTEVLSFVSPAGEGSRRNFRKAKQLHFAPEVASSNKESHM